MKSPLMKHIGMATWFITSVASINVLTNVYGYNFLSFIAMQMPALLMPVLWIIGISGVVCLAFWIMSLKGCMCCGKNPCGCGMPSGQGQQQRGM